MAPIDAQARIPASNETHELHIGWKLGYSGQTRTYYRGECSCGWTAKGYRVTEERATDDHAAHLVEAPA